MVQREIQRATVDRLEQALLDARRRLLYGDKRVRRTIDAIKKELARRGVAA